jgi:iron complex transport system substrate-binding protein
MGIKSLQLLLYILISAGCARHGVPASKVVHDGAAPDSGLPEVHHASGFRFERGGAGVTLILSDPMDNRREIARYRLLEKPSGTPDKGCTDLIVPLQRIVASSTTHAGFLAAIGASGSLMGCNNPERLYDSTLFARFKNGDLVRTGRDLGYNLEFLIASKPELVLQSGIDGQFVAEPRLTASGIPVMFVLEWMEPTPLGRAEWMKVFGMITGRAREADSLFREVERSYLAKAKVGHEAADKVKVLTGNVFKGTWYMPGGRNYMTRFFEDAGMDYLWKDNNQSSSLALSFESVVYKMADAPVWINVNVDSLSHLVAAESRYSVFRALKEKRVYSVFNRINEHGANDFWESAVVRPDRVLADLLAIAHPESEPGHLWFYYKPLVYN